MSHPGRRTTNKWGMPKHIVRSERPSFVSDRAEVCLDKRDDFQGLLLDALAAYKAAIISRQQYDIEHARLRRAIWTAEQEYEQEYRKKWRSQQKGRR